MQKPKYTRLRTMSISTVRRFPRLGHIRLGIKEEKNGKTYPKEVDYFVCPPEVQRVYGEQPTALPILFPVDDPEIIFMQKLALYKANGLFCHGDGETAERREALELVNTTQWVGRTCPCEHLRTPDNPKGQCHPIAHLMVILPEVNMGGVYQLTTGSWNSVVDINSGLDYVRELLGRIAMVPLTLSRVPKEIQHGKALRTHWPCTITLDADLDAVVQLRADTTRVLSSTHYQIEAPSDDMVVVPEDAVETLEQSIPALPEPAHEPAPEPAPAPDPDAAHLIWQNWVDTIKTQGVYLQPFLSKFHITSLSELPEAQRGAFRLTVEDSLKQQAPARPRSRARRGVTISR